MAADQSDSRPEGLIPSSLPSFLQEPDREWRDIWNTIWPGLGDASYQLEQFVMAYRTSTLEPRQLRAGMLLSRLKRVAEEMLFEANSHFSKLQKKYKLTPEEIHKLYPEESHIPRVIELLPEWNDLRARAANALRAVPMRSSHALVTDQHWAEFKLRLMKEKPKDEDSEDTENEAV